MAKVQKSYRGHSSLQLLKKCVLDPDNGGFFLWWFCGAHLIPCQVSSLVWLHWADGRKLGLRLSPRAVALWGKMRAQQDKYNRERGF